MPRYLSLLLPALLVATAGASAATVSVRVTDDKGRPAPNAVVELAPAGEMEVAPQTPEHGIIAQRDETFIPLVVIVRRGGSVVFTNNDTTMHQVYSFSPVKRFAFEIDRGRVSKPVFFERPGVAAIGCNIHDQMIAYVYVAAGPFAALSDATGTASFDKVPDGAWHVTVWHPQLPPGHPWPSGTLTVSGDRAAMSFAVPLLAAGPRGMKHMHMGY